MAAPQDPHSKNKKVGQDGTVFHCPVCKTVLPNAEVATFPFCSERCKLIDLNNWISGKYTVSRPIDPTDHIQDVPGRPGGSAN